MPTFLEELSLVQEATPLTVPNTRFSCAFHCYHVKTEQSLSDLYCMM